MVSAIRCSCLVVFVTEYFIVCVAVSMEAVGLYKMSDEHLWLFLWLLCGCASTFTGSKSLLYYLTYFCSRIYENQTRYTRDPDQCYTFLPPFYPSLIKHTSTHTMSHALLMLSSLLVTLSIIASARQSGKGLCASGDHQACPLLGCCI